MARKKEGQKQLASLIIQLSKAKELKLIIPEELQTSLNHEHITTLKGRALKTNEDNLDAIICLYTAGLFAKRSPGVTFGNKNDGAIWVPYGDEREEMRV